MIRIIFLCIGAVFFCSCEKTGQVKKDPAPLLPCTLDKIFRSHQHLAGDSFAVEVLSWGSASVGRYLVLYSEPYKDMYTSAQGDLDGKILKSWLTDLDKDALPEIIIESESAGSGSYGNVIIYEAGRGNLKKISFPALPQQLSEGYGGHDIYTLSGDTLIRNYVSYHKEDANAKPTGDSITIRYQMKNDSVLILALKK
jgi:hypothetical protein